MALQRKGIPTSYPIRDRQGFYGVPTSTPGTEIYQTTPKPTFLDAGLSISEPVDCNIFRRTKDAEPRVMSNAMWATYKKGLPEMRDGWSARSGTYRLISDSEGRFVHNVSPPVWEVWVSELEQDTRTLLPGYSLIQALGQYVRYNKQGRIVAAVDRFTWKERRAEWAAAGSTVHLPEHVVSVWQGRRKVAVFDRADWKQAKSQYMQDTTPAVTGSRPDFRRRSTTSSRSGSMSGASTKSRT